MYSSPTVTLGYYAYFTPEGGSKGRTVIDGLLGKGLHGWKGLLRDRMAWEKNDD